MSLLKALDRVAEHVPTKFIAPIPDANVVQVVSIQDGIPYWFSLHDPQPGWWVVEPTSKSDAKLLAQALPADWIRYLDQLPSFHVITLFPVSESTWMVMPYNAADAAQRGWANACPRPMHLVDESLNSLQVACACALGNTLLYDMLDMRGLGNTPEFVTAANIVQEHQNEMYRRELEKVKAQKKRSVGDEIRHQLEFSGAKLLDWTDQGYDGYTVTWEHDGATWTMDVARDLTVSSAGICLDGTQQYHDLATIVPVMMEGRRRHRFDIPKELWT